MWPLIASLSLVLGFLAGFWCGWKDGSDHEYNEGYEAGLGDGAEMTEEELRHNYLKRVENQRMEQDKKGISVSKKIDANWN